MYRFVTDGSVVNRGFRLNYTTQESLCGGILKEDFGVIRTPVEIESNYPHNVECTWIVQGGLGTVVSFYVQCGKG